MLIYIFNKISKDDMHFVGKITWQFLLLGASTTICFFTQDVLTIWVVIIIILKLFVDDGYTWTVMHAKW